MDPERRFWGLYIYDWNYATAIWCMYTWSVSSSCSVACGHAACVHLLPSTTSQSLRTPCCRISKMRWQALRTVELGPPPALFDLDFEFASYTLSVTSHAATPLLRCPATHKLATHSRQNAKMHLSIYTLHITHSSSQILHRTAFSSTKAVNVRQRHLAIDEQSTYKTGEESARCGFALRDTI